MPGLAKFDGTGWTLGCKKKAELHVDRHADHRPSLKFGLWCRFSYDNARRWCPRCLGFDSLYIWIYKCRSFVVEMMCEYVLLSQSSLHSTKTNSRTQQPWLLCFRLYSTSGETVPPPPVSNSQTKAWRSRPSKRLVEHHNHRRFIFPHVLPALGEISWLNTTELRPIQSENFLYKMQKIVFAQLFYFQIFLYVFFSVWWNAKGSKMVCLLWNFQSFEVFPFFSRFSCWSWKKNGKSGKSCCLIWTAQRSSVVACKVARVPTTRTYLVYRSKRSLAGY